MAIHFLVINSAQRYIASSNLDQKDQREKLEAQDIFVHKILFAVNFYDENAVKLFLKESLPAYKQLSKDSAKTQKENITVTIYTDFEQKLASINKIYLEESYYRIKSLLNILEEDLKRFRKYEHIYRGLSEIYNDYQLISKKLELNLKNNKFNISPENINLLINQILIIDERLRKLSN